MASKHANIWAALRNHLEAYPDKPDFIAYGGESFDPPNPNLPYWIVDDLRFEPERIYYGTDCANWMTGSLIVNCMVPITWDNSQTAGYAGRLADYFKQDTPMTFEDVTVRVSNQPYVSTTGLRDGDRWRVPVSTSWEGFV